MNSTKKARFSFIFAMAIFGTLAPFVRNITVSSGELALYRAVMAAALIALFLTFTKQKIPFAEIKKDIPLLLVSGGAMGINWILLFEAYKYTTVSAATLSYYFAPVIVTAVSLFLFHEKLSFRQAICFVMATVGIVLITVTDGFSEGEKDFIGILFGLGAAVFYASVILMNKFIKNVEGIHRTLLQFFSAIAVLLPYVAFNGGTSLSALDPSGWINLLVVGLFHTGFAYCLYFSSLKELSGQETAILSYIDPLAAVIISVSVLGETLTVLQVIGGILILGFTLWNEISAKRK